MTTVMMASSNHSVPAPAHKCFLCEVPKGPWAMLYEFSEPVCRACCNYEGMDKISEVIEKAKHLRKSFEIPVPRHSVPSQQHSPPAISQGHVVSPHEQPVGIGFVPAVTVGGVTRPVVAAHNTLRQHPPYMITSRDGLGKVHVVSPASTKNVPGFAIPAMPQQSFAPQMQRVNGVPTSVYPMHNHGKVHFPTDVLPSQDSTTQRFAQIQDTLNTLSKSPPFRVRFSKDHSLIGRVIAFDAVCRGSDYELKVFIEYPVGSGTVFQSASGAGRQMYGEFRERLGIGGGFRGASSNGYKDLEFERINGEDDWKVLGELLTEEVRFFRGSIKKDLLPTPYLDPKHPDLPPATLNATRGFLKNNLLNRKRKSSSEEQDSNEPRKERKVDAVNGSNGSLERGSRSPRSPSRSPKLNGHSRSPLGSPMECKTPTTPASPPSSNGDAHMQCLICNRTLEDTRFVQCPSKHSHKFCFNCSADSIKTQSANCSDVYCPSGDKCLVAGSTTPWAFMEQEIKTIVGNSI